MSVRSESFCYLIARIIMAVLLGGALIYRSAFKSWNTRTYRAVNMSRSQQLTLTVLSLHDAVRFVCCFLASFGLVGITVAKDGKGIGLSRGMVTVRFM